MKMKRFKAPKQNSKISDFFSKSQLSNEETSKRKISNTQSNAENSFSPIAKKSKQDIENVDPFSMLEVTLDIQGEEPTTCTGFKTTTPEKSIRPSTSMSSTPKSKTPSSSKKSTPKKLFEKTTPNKNDFNIKVFDSFVKISPSTSNKIIRITPKKEQGSVQILQETTPSKSKKTLFASPKFKASLNFDSGKSEAEFNSLLDEDFNNISFEEPEPNLDLNEPKQCKILEAKRSNYEFILKLQAVKSKSVGFCKITGFWAGHGYTPGDFIRIQAAKNQNEWFINNENGWLVYEPDLLISCTSVVGSLFCKRRGVFANRFRGFEPGNKVMLIGVLVHTILQQALKKKLTTYEQIENVLNLQLSSKDNIKKMYETGTSLEEIQSEVRVFIPKLVEFISDYLSGNGSTGNWRGKICDIDDIEENLWCPELGIKGKIDVTVKTDGGTMPLELKTGRATVSLEHRGQVVLYIMMMNKFGYNVSSGLLLYLREGVLKDVKATPQEKRDVMILRNELAYFLTRKVGNDVKKIVDLPEPLDNPRACPKCPYNIICTSYLKSEPDIRINKSIKDVQRNVTSHLTQEHLEYFLQWSNFLCMEDEMNEVNKSVRRIYTVSPQQRESSGRCIINLKVSSVQENENGLFEHCFEKETKENLAIYDIVENNYVVVSTNKRPAVATGFVTEVSSSRISVQLDSNLKKKYSEVFHLDSYDSNITFTFNMTSLALLLENSPRAAELRSIIIDKKPPRFQEKLPAVVAKRGAVILKKLNAVQQRAVLKALSAKDFFLIKGMPGTGKSATIVALIELLVKLDKSVLITSHTHSAIDNICNRLKKHGVDFLRLGSDSKIDPNLVSNSEATLTKNCKSAEEIQQVYNKYNVIASTCLGSGHTLLSKRVVDVCIVDESTQVLQTAILKPLYAAKTFVLIGDPNQLAPLVKHNVASKAGMNESLFERLENSEGTVVLNLNYRMNETITHLANVLTYKGELQPANEHVAKKTLHIPKLSLIKKLYKDYKWLQQAINPSLEASVQLINTGPVYKLPKEVANELKFSDFCNGYETTNCQNVYEATIVLKLVEAFVKGGVANKDIGVMATYRAQVTLLADVLQQMNVDVSTVDQYQGRDKPVIIYSCTKSAEKISSDKTELLEDKRRLTVAVTRAKQKLILVGDVTTLEKLSTFSKILPTLQRNTIEFDSSWTVMRSV